VAEILAATPKSAKEKKMKLNFDNKSSKMIYQV
jgi:hypothetical protein